MKDRSFDPRALDVAAFCRAGASLSGAWPLAAMTRLAESLAAVSDTAVAWTASGRLVPVAGGEPEFWMDLQAQAEVPLQCQRCLQPMIEPLAVARPFRFARTEAEAAVLDEESEEDVLVLQARLDLHDLVEDELILALPLVPRHADCTPLAAASAVPAAPDGPEEAAAPHPFAALAALRRSSVNAAPGADGAAGDAGDAGDAGYAGDAGDAGPESDARSLRRGPPQR